MTLYQQVDETGLVPAFEAWCEDNDGDYSDFCEEVEDERTEALIAATEDQ